MYTLKVHSEINDSKVIFGRSKVDFSEKQSTCIWTGSIIMISSQQRISFTISSLRDGVGLGMCQNKETYWTKLNY